MSGTRGVRPHAACCYTLTQSDFGEYGAKASPVENSPFGYWQIPLPVDLSYDDAQAICEQLEENPAVAYTAHAPNLFMDAVAPEQISVELAEIAVRTETEVFGDVNCDGVLNVKDSQTALMAAAAILSELEPRISEEQIKIADVDGDGTLTPKDSQYILLYAAYTMSEIETSWRTLTGNPSAPDHSNLG